MKKWLSLTAVTLSLMCLLTGCGGDDTSSQSTTETTSAATESSAAETTATHTETSDSHTDNNDNNGAVGDIITDAGDMVDDIIPDSNSTTEKNDSAR